MADSYCGIIPISHAFAHHIHKLFNGLLSASYLSNRDKMSFVVNVEKRFNAKNRACYGGRLLYSATSVEIFQVVNCENMA